MKKAAFAAVAVLAVSVIWAADLFSQGGPVETAVEAEAGFADGYITASEAEALRWKLRKVVELNLKTMSADELREAIQVIERFGVEPELAPVIDQLRLIEEKHLGTTVARKARLAVRLLQTRDEAVLSEAQRLLSQDTEQMQMELRGSPLRGTP